MKKNKMGLVFLSSQPRSGSTLTQKILSAHPNIYTRSEPWLMLHPIYRFKKSLTNIEYNNWLSNRAFENFTSELPGGKRAYREALRTMYESLYHAYLKKHSKTLFLDKTPRYYLILHELHDIFPEAKQVLLIRNPLSVLRSIINTWTKNDHAKLIEYKVDFYKAIEIFDSMLFKHPSWLYIMHYEKLLEKPEEQLSSLCNYLEIEYDSQILNYHKKPQEKWEFGDPESVYAKKGIDSKITTMNWLGKIDDSQKWRFFYDYLNFIGQERYVRLGYNFDEDMQYLMNAIPEESLEKLLLNTQSLDSYLNPSSESQEKSRVETQLILRDKNKKIESLEIETDKMKMKIDALENELDTIKKNKLRGLLKIFKSSK